MEIHGGFSAQRVIKTMGKEGGRAMKPKIKKKLEKKRVKVRIGKGSCSICD